MDGEVHVDELRGALVMCGFCDARQGVVTRVLQGLTSFWTLSKALGARFFLGRRWF